MTLQAEWGKAAEIVTNLCALEVTDDMQVLMLRRGYHLEETTYTRLPSGAEEIVIFVGGVWYLRDVTGNIVVQPEHIKKRGEVKRTYYDPDLFTPSNWGDIATRWADYTENTTRKATSSIDIVIVHGQIVAGVSLIPQWQGREGNESGQLDMRSFEAQVKWEEQLTLSNQPVSLHTQYVNFATMRGLLKI
jgi:hypothetical protein